MGKVLTILEVSRKQDYIFGSKKLRENAERSQDIAGITSSAFFTASAGDAYREESNLVNTGGGHAVLQFDDRQDAVAFTRRVTLAALRAYPELELFARTIDYDPNLNPGENLRRLTQALEEKKARRSASFRRLDFGVEALREAEERPFEQRRKQEIVPLPETFTYFSDPEKDLSDNFLAVVHIDGNNMGARVGGLYQEFADRTDPENWEACRNALQHFSRGIQQDFETAFSQLAETVALSFKGEKVLPIRPIILAGDDVCFVTAGSIGLECARIFIEKLTALTPTAGGEPYAACAGVALVHRKYPFHRAYQLAEALCDNAKKYSAELDRERRVSAIDWHIEFGQMKDSLADLREDYETEDGCRLELRPVTVVVPDEKIPAVSERSYQFFRTMCLTLEKNRWSVARSKIKELRTALKQGEVEGRFFLHDKGISDLLYAPLEAAYTQKEWAEKVWDKAAFQPFPEESGIKKRCLFFDAIEMTDHFTPLEEVVL